MKAITSLTNHFLIAMPGLADPNFARSVTLICEHSDKGAMGIVINRTTELKLRDIFEQLDIPASDSRLADMPVFYGGPVQNHRGFVVHAPLGHWDATLPVTEHLGVSTSRDILEAIAENDGPERCLVALGYAGWAPGQLEREILENSWLYGPANDEILFSVPVENRWKEAARAAGVNLERLSTDTGHA